MATASTTAHNDTKTTPAGEMTDIAQKFREQLVSSLQPQPGARLMMQRQWEQCYRVHPQEVICNCRKTGHPQRFRIRICIS